MAVGLAAGKSHRETIARMADADEGKLGNSWLDSHLFRL